MEELDNRAHLNATFLLQRLCMPAYSWGMHSPLLLSLLVRQISYGWLPLYQNQTSLTIITFSNWRPVLSFNWEAPNSKKEQNLENRNHKIEKNHEPRKRVCNGRQKNHKSFLWFESNQQDFFSFTCCCQIWLIGQLFSFKDHYTSSKYVHNHAASLRWEKETWFLFVVNLVNHNICMLSSNDNVRQNEPQRALWAWVLKATGWQIHVGEQGREEASSWLCATTTPAPHSQDFCSDRDSVTSSRWHILMADAHRKTKFFFKGVTASFFITSNSTVITIYQSLNLCCKFKLMKYDEMHNRVSAVWIEFKDYCSPLSGHLSLATIT